MASPGVAATHAPPGACEVRLPPRQLTLPGPLLNPPSRALSSGRAESMDTLDTATREQRGPTRPAHAGRKKPSARATPAEELAHAMNLDSS